MRFPKTCQDFVLLPSDDSETQQTFLKERASTEGPNWVETNNALSKPVPWYTGLNTSLE